MIVVKGAVKKGTANYEQLLVVMGKLEAFAKRIGAEREADAFGKLRVHLETDKYSTEPVEESAFKWRGMLAVKALRGPVGETDEKGLEFKRLKEELESALFPPKKARFPETKVQGLGGTGNYETFVYGDPKDAQIIATRAMDAVMQFSSAVFAEDIEKAYALCANELRTWMGVKRFVSELAKADGTFGGKAVRCVIEGVTLIETDDNARKKSGNSKANWPKDTPSSNKRAIVIAFWFTDRTGDAGRWVQLWVTEEAEGYRVAKFHQYVQ